MIYYIKGDATYPKEPGVKFIAHICNDIGAWGAGFVLAISKRWKEPELAYRSLQNYVLGDVQYIDVEKDITVCNMIAQKGIGRSNGIPPIRYDAVYEALHSIFFVASIYNGTIHMPRIGCGLAGGKWEEIEKILIELNKLFVTDVYVYDFEK